MLKKVVNFLTGKDEADNRPKVVINAEKKLAKAVKKAEGKSRALKKNIDKSEALLKKVAENKKALTESFQKTTSDSTEIQKALNSLRSAKPAAQKPQPQPKKK